MSSLGYVFKRARERRKMTVEQVYKVIKVQPQYLRAIEKDDYSLFSSTVHATGFLKIYADFLGLNTPDILALWRRDYSVDIPSKKSYRQALPKYEEKSVVITPSIIIISVVGILLLGFFAYLFFQYKNYTDVPNLEVTTPQNNQVFEDDIIEVAGTTDPGASVYLNNQRIDVSPDGNFSTQLKLNEGINSLTVTAKSQLERESERVISVLYRKVVPPSVPDTVETTPTVSEQNQ